MGVGGGGGGDGGVGFGEWLGGAWMEWDGDFTQLVGILRYGFDMFERWIERGGSVKREKGEPGFGQVCMYGCVPSPPFILAHESRQSYPTSRTTSSQIRYFLENQCRFAPGAGNVEERNARVVSLLQNGGGKNGEG